MKRFNRRQLLAQVGALAAGAPIAPATAGGQSDASMRVAVVGAHPGDPEAGCGGTIARYTQSGHDVTVVYLTRGEAGVQRKTASQAAAIRSAEAQQACKILKATPVFAGQIDAATEASPQRNKEFARLIQGLRPDIVFTQWPIDTHPDHRVCSALTLAAWVDSGRKFSLCFYEVDLGSDTQCFRPTHYVDVTATEALKHDACMAHRSQDPKGFYLRDHVPMLRFRGLECGCKAAEAFIHHDASPPGRLPT